MILRQEVARREQIERSGLQVVTSETQPAA
jgi:hypothetical protein